MAADLDYFVYIRSKYNEKTASIKMRMLENLDQIHQKITEVDQTILQLDVEAQIFELQLNLIDAQSSNVSSSDPPSPPYLYGSITRTSAYEPTELASLIALISRWRIDRDSSYDSTDAARKSDTEQLCRLPVKCGDLVRLWEHPEDGWWIAEHISSPPVSTGLGLIGDTFVVIVHLGALQQALDRRMAELKLALLDSWTRQGAIQGPEDLEKREKIYQIIDKVFKTRYFNPFDFLNLTQARQRVQGLHKDIVDSREGLLKCALDRKMINLLEYHQVETTYFSMLDEAERDYKRAIMAKGGFLYAACEVGDYNKVQELVNKSSRWAAGREEFVNTLDESGVGALHIACLQGSWGVPLALLLTNYGADPLLADRIAQTPGDTCVHYAARSGDSVMLALLMDSWLRGREQPAVHIFLEAPGYKGRTSLAAAVESGQLETVVWLLAQGASPSAVDQYADTPLHACARRGDVALATCLLDSRADPLLRNCLGKSPMLLSVQSGQLDVAQLFVDKHGVWLSQEDICELALAPGKEREAGMFVLQAIMEGHLKDIISQSLDRVVTLKED